MVELTKEDLCMILEVTLLNFEGLDLYKCLNYDIKTKHIMLGKKVLEFIEKEWR
jgi:hypothetical protein